MVDIVECTCGTCGGKFKVWLRRGEIALAQCLGCWWADPANSCEGLGIVPTAADQNRNGEECPDQASGEVVRGLVRKLSPKERGKTT